MIRHSSAVAVDLVMCASMNLVQSRHRLTAHSRAQMECYVADCEKISVHEYYAPPDASGIDGAIPEKSGATVAWPSPVTTGYARNDVACAQVFPCSRGWSAPTVIMLHALMSAHAIGYRRWARRFNDLGWNVCFMHLPFHYSRVPPGRWNGELAVTADLIRNAEGLRQGVMEVRQLMAALRALGCREFGILGSSYGGWIGALLAAVEKDFRFIALMAPIVHVAHAIWQCPATAFMRRELHRVQIDPSLVARHFHLSSPMHLEPLGGADPVLLTAGEFDLIVRSADVVALHEKWRGSQLLRTRQGHFGYRMMRETVAHLQRSGRLADRSTRGES
jgi:pimeloyl-ACP methyl ester carboxylesterase